MKYKLFDIVVVLEDLETENLQKGERGTIIEIFSNPCIAYEVEFIDDRGVTFKQIPLLPTQISPWSSD
ncbi:DUF4926 domain-containing protein [Bartonella sp. HY406]|uniref:DUF4926 domain-containing protein n=1 Tax=Bartonella sp. HY406 TaxID=2979331 RepID=UPI0021CA428F|nr:DUF4926 domain-containing protein [Bartonella sp. HY406]UXN05027.1 DUF4926 domain-containing protein [Bartonella sp. HY406]